MSLEEETSQYSNGSERNWGIKVTGDLFGENKENKAVGRAST